MQKSVPFRRTVIASMLTLAAGVVSTVHAAPATTAAENAPK